MTMVVSSSSEPSCRTRVSSTSLLTAVSGDSMCRAARETASWLESASQRPSDAMMANLSSGLSLWLDMTGSGMMPTLRAQPSPMDRPMASPGFFKPQSSHTRWGPMYSPCILAGATTPPCISILSFSAGMSGLMSSVSGTACHAESWLRRPMTARESPTLAQCSTLCSRSMQTTTAVVPLYSTSPASCLYTSSSALTTAFDRALLASLLRDASAPKWPAMRLAASRETSCPQRPWPSRTPKRACRTGWAASWDSAGALGSP
mmetsp:Transcript_46941/g.145355  ORF Transcript_46941/g.145355 Transcript_46941/m.145355 type:complete len:261 (+) Transcript_46941:140-922(+)